VQVAFQAGAGFLVLGGSRWLEKKGHPKWARALLIADILSEGIAVGQNLAIRGDKTPAPIPQKPTETGKPVFY